MDHGWGGLLAHPLAILGISSTLELALEQGDAASGGVQVRADTDGTHTEAATFPGWAHRSRHRHKWRGGHADGQKEVLSMVVMVVVVMIM